MRWKVMDVTPEHQRNMMIVILIAIALCLGSNIYVFASNKIIVDNERAICERVGLVACG